MLVQPTSATAFMHTSLHLSLCVTVPAVQHSNETQWENALSVTAAFSVLSNQKTSCLNCYGRRHVHSDICCNNSLSSLQVKRSICLSVSSVLWTVWSLSTHVGLTVNYTSPSNSETPLTAKKKNPHQCDRSELHGGFVFVPRLLGVQTGHPMMPPPLALWLPWLQV